MDFILICYNVLNCNKIYHEKFILISLEEIQNMIEIVMDMNFYQEKRCLNNKNRLCFNFGKFV